MPHGREGVNAPRQTARGPLRVPPPTGPERRYAIVA